MARLAADVLRVLSFRHQSRMGSGSKVARDVFVAGLTFLRADELRARNAGRRKKCSISCATRKQNYGERGYPPERPKQLFALTVRPSI